MYLEFALKYKVKQSKNGKFPSHYKLAQSILKRKFPSVHKPLKNISPEAYFRNFTVLQSFGLAIVAVVDPGSTPYFPTLDILQLIFYLR